ncbi:MAG: sulfite exporter TauE/SafE family protein [Vulcanisaeta sp.]|nr:sulfite exporter TauE/SafE family protein [Vulcanisaeta sp.]
MIELFGLALIISFVASQGGISGAYLLVPAQIYILGALSPVVSSTNLMYNVIATPLSIYRYLREGRVVKQLALTLALGGMAGSIAGSYIRVFLIGAEVFRVFVDAVLLILGIELIMTVRAVRARKQLVTAVKVLGVRSGRLFFLFSDKVFSVSLPMIFALSFIIGVVGGIYGIGGASIMAPILLTAFNLPVYVTAGATLIGTLAGSIPSLVTYSILGFGPNISVGVSIGFGGLMGSYLGASIQRRVPEWVIRLMLSIMTILLGLLDLLIHLA